MNRRTFLKTTSGGLGGLVLLNSCASLVFFDKSNANTPRKGQLLLSVEDPNSSTSSILRFFNWDTYAYTDYSIGVKSPHSILQNKTNSDEFYFFELFGSAAKVNIRTQSIARINQATEGVMSYGHGVQTADGEYLLCTEFSNHSKNARIGIRSAATMELLGTAPEVMASHHIVHLPGSTIIACGSARSQDGSTSVCFYDYKKEILIRQEFLDFDVSHLLPISPSEIIGLGVRRNLAQTKKEIKYFQKSEENVRNLVAALTMEPAPAFYMSLHSPTRIFWDEGKKELFNFGFGLVAKSGRIIASYFESNVVIVWKDFEIERVIPILRPQHVILSKDASEFMVQASGKLFIFSSETLAEIHRISYPSAVHVAGPFI